MVGYLQKSSTTIMRIKIKSASMSKCRENSEAFLFVFLNGDSLHARLSSHYKAWSYMIRKLQLRYRTLPKNCSFIYKFNVSGICEKLKQEFNNCMVSKNVYYFQLPKNAFFSDSHLLFLCTFLRIIQKTACNNFFFQDLLDDNTMLVQKSSFSSVCHPAAT